MEEITAFDMDDLPSTAIFTVPVIHDQLYAVRLKLVRTETGAYFEVEDEETATLLRKMRNPDSSTPCGLIH